MQDPVGATFNYETMRMELADFWAVMFNPTAQAKFVHTVSAGYVTGAVFVLAISSWYLVKGRNVEFAKRSFRIAAAFGLASAASVIVLGDESGYTVTEAQQTKLAAMEAMWETEPAPAGFTLFAIPNEREMRNDYAIHVPWVMGLIGTRSLSQEIPGIAEIKERNRERVLAGIEAVVALEALRADPADAAARAALDRHLPDLGFGLLLKRYVTDVRDATPAMIDQAVAGTIPRVTPMFWAFRLMVGFGFALFALFAVASYHTLKGGFERKRWLLWWALLFLPVPWLAAELGWFVAEYGRQPWTIFGVLPTHLSVSSLEVGSLYGSLAGFVGFYTLLAIADVYLMTRFARQGPGSLGTGRYDRDPGAGGTMQPAPSGPVRE